MRKILNYSIKVKHILLLLIIIGVTKFGIDVYQNYYIMEITSNNPPERAFKIIAKERSEKWWLRV